MEEKRSFGFCAIHCFGSSKEKKRKLGFEGLKKIEVWITCMETCLGLCMDLLVRKPS